MDLHLEVLEEGLNAVLHNFMVGQPRQTTNINPTAGVTVELSKAGLLLFAPAANIEWRRRVVDTLLGLCDTRPNLQRAAQHVDAIKLGHSTAGMLFVLQIDEAVRWVTASERINGDIDTLTITRLVVGPSRSIQARHTSASAQP